MRIQTLKATFKAAARVMSLLFLGAVVSFAQQQVNLSAGPSNAVMPDGTSVPMWGYSCGAVVAGSTATCASLNPNAVAGTWSPIVITVPTTAAGGLQLNLTNNLTFAPAATTANPTPTANQIPTSLTIVGLVGGGLGSSATKVPSPIHPSQVVTWSTVGSTPAFTPPPQPDRVQSFATEVAVGTTANLVWANLRPGTYLIESGTHPSIQGPMGLYGILVVTSAPTSTSATVGTVTTTTETAAGTAYPGINYDAEIPLLFSEIDPVQNNSVNAAVNTAGFSETMVWSGQPGGCGNPSSTTFNQCYPPAVNYTPLYYTINGVAFDKTHSSNSLFATSPNATSTPLAGVTQNILVRMVNAGLRMHVPSIVNSTTTDVGSGTPKQVSGFSLIAEDGNVLPGNHRVQTDVLMVPGKVMDVMINVPAACVPATAGGACTNPAIPVFDRELSLSGNAIDRDAGMLAYINVNGGVLPSVGAFSAATARPDNYPSLVAGQTLTVSDASKGVIANDTNVYGVQLDATKPAANGSVTLNANGTFTYVPSGTSTSDSFGYCANGTTQTSTTPICTTVTLGAAAVEAAGGIKAYPRQYNAITATSLALKSPGVLGPAYDALGNGADTDAAGYPLRVAVSSIAASTGLTVHADAEGGFTATANAAGTYTFTYQAQNSQGTLSAAATVTLVFPQGSGLQVTVLDGNDKTTKITDYRWIIEEDRTFYVNPACTTNPPPAGCPGAGGIVPTFGVNFHTSYMPYVAQGCTGPLSCEGGQMMYDNNPSSPTFGQHINAVCDIGDGVCRPDSTGNGFTPVLPSSVHLDPTKRYYISILPGDAATPFLNGYGGAPSNCSTTPATAAGAASPTTASTTCGHGMGGAPLTFGQLAVTVLAQPSPYPPGKLSVVVFEDDFPLNGEQDSGGGIDVLATNEPGLGDFNIVLTDQAGRFGDVTGQMTYDMFNQPLSNALSGQLDPATGNDACPIANNSRQGVNDPNQTGITGMIVTCPKYESDGKTLSPLAGQVVVTNLMPGFWSVIATPGADRIARGEEWLQTNTLDGQKGLDSFVRIGEPAYFQEYGPAGYHDSIGFANPAIINARKQGVCAGSDPNLTAAHCANTLSGKITGERLSRTPDERLYSSGSHDTYYWTQCYVSFGDPDGEDFAFTKCAADGTWTLSGLPDGNWRITVFDQWNDQIVDGLTTPVYLSAATNPNCPGPGSSGTVCNMGDVAEQQWQSDIYSRTFVDDNKDGVAQSDEGGIPFLNTTVRFRDGSMANNLLTDFTGTANFNEEFPYFAWVMIEADTTRYKTTGIHTVYDIGGPTDGSPTCLANVPGYPPCGTSKNFALLANTQEQVSLPTQLRVPGAVYCPVADCTGLSIATGPETGGSSGATSNCTGPVTAPATCGTPSVSSGRIDPPWVVSEAWQGFIGQNNFVEFGKTPYVPGENGGIHGHVIYASTRPFDDPQMLVQTQWESLVPHVTMNLYQEGFAADGITPTLKLVDTMQTSSWDDFAQGFRSDGIPNINCAGQGSSTGPDADLFFFTLANQPNFLDSYNAAHGGPATTALPYQSQFKCYDGMHDWNHVEPAPYDGMYSFPSVTGINPTTGRVTGTNCTACVTDPDASDPYRYGGSTTPAPYVSGVSQGVPMLPPGKYVVEVVLPPGYELVKEEDKNILIGDNFIAPVTQEFGGLGNIFIVPDQASVATAQQYPGPGYNANNAQNATQSLGAGEQNGIVPGFTPEPVWPCVGEARIVPDYISLYPQTHQVAPFAGATRNLCDKKEVTLGDQMGAIAKFYIYTSTHVAAKYTGIITDDFTSEFDPFSPTFGEKFSPPNMPISFRDWTFNEISRVYSDQWGVFNGMTYSTWEVNPPNPTGYSPTMMITCMNDPGPILDTNPTSPTFNQMITDPLFNPEYSQFCYENPYMPAQTQYMDTPVVPTSAFVSAGYNNVDCNYPDLTPAISQVNSDAGVGPWVPNDNKTHLLTITALGNQTVGNYGYAGPSANTAPYNQKTITRHYGFGNRCTSPSAASLTCNTRSSATIGGVNAPIQNWSDTQIVVEVPDSNIAKCAVQQQAQYGGSTAFCGELVITAGNGKQSIDAITVTIGGKAPTYVTPPQTIQSALDAAAPGDLIIVKPGTYNELDIMWKPVRLQGVGAASTIINANTHPAGLLTPWRARVDCLFGIALDGQPYTGNVTVTSGNVVPGTGGSNPFDSTGAATCPGTGWSYFTGGPQNPQVDRVPLEGIVGWDTTVNGNLAELLQEPSLLGAYEGSGITVLGKGVRIPPGSTNVFGTGSEAGFPTGSTLLTSSTTDCGKGVSNTKGFVANQFTSNFLCNPSSIDGLSIIDSSQGGGGITLHAWNHDMQIANNRIYNNAGTLGGGITVGQGEYPEAYLAPNNNPENALPGSCQDSLITNTQLPYCFNLNVNIHNNYVSLNSSTGDELFSSTPAGAGGVNFCTGSDYYQFNYNWVCGNVSTGDGGGIAHLGFSYDGRIEHNTIMFNQSTNPTIPTNGGGLIVMGAAPDGFTLVNGVQVECGSVTDVDCVPGLSDGAGPGLVINANLFQGNSADSGSGGGLRFQAVNGADVPRFPANPERWYDVQVTNNIISNNVAGWDGAGVSLEDALNINFINNTVVSNDTTASAGVLFNTLGAPLASSQSPAPNQCPSNPCGTTSSPQAAGLVSMQNSPQLTSSLTTGPVTCPEGHFQGATQTNGTCTKFSYPLLQNDVFWQNSAYFIGVGALSNTVQQNIVTLYNMDGTKANTQPQATSTTAEGSGVVITGGTGACVTRNFWDIGVRGDTGPTDHSSSVILAPSYSILTNNVSSVYNATGENNAFGDPHFISEYCNGSRTPPEMGGLAGWQVPPGISDAVIPNPIFNLSPAATVDEGNNWINLSWGPLSMTNPTVKGTDGNYGGGVLLGNYGPADSGSSAVGRVSCNTTVDSAYENAPDFDFYGNERVKVAVCGAHSQLDAGAVEFNNERTTSGPQIVAVDPDEALVGTTGLVLNLSGSGFTGVAGLTFTPATGITTSNTAVENDSSINTTITVRSNAVPGVRTISVAGSAEGVQFTVTAASPQFSPMASATNCGPAPNPPCNTHEMDSFPANLQRKTGTITITNNAAATGPFILTATPGVIVANPITGVPVFNDGTASVIGGTCVAGAEVDPGSSCTVIVQYVPTRTATVNLRVVLTGLGIIGGSVEASNSMAIAAN